MYFLLFIEKSIPIFLIDWMTISARTLGGF
jgi:hypothetical protein